MHLLGFSAGIVIAIVLVLLFILLFEIWMFVAAILNPHISNERRILWLVGMLLVHPFVAIAYYFTDHQRRKA